MSPRSTRWHERTSVSCLGELLLKIKEYKNYKYVPLNESYTIFLLFRLIDVLAQEHKIECLCSASMKAPHVQLK